jgi:uncharacterized membrane protein YccC
MRLTKSKSWSQQQLAVKLGVDGIAARGVLNWERKRLLIHAGRTALAAALCWWIALQFGLTDGYWGAISAIIVLQSNFGATINASRDRILGTIIGAAFGFAFSLFGVLPWNYILAVLCAVILCGLLGLRNSSRLAGVTISIIMLVQKGDSHWVLALHRVGEVFLGILIAILVSTLFFPDRARLRLRDGLAQEFLVLNAFFEGILQGSADFRPTTLPSFAKMHSPCYAATMLSSTLPAMSPRAARDGARAWECWPNSAVLFSTLSLHWSSPCAKATKIITQRSWSPS